MHFNIQRQFFWHTCIQNIFENINIRTPLVTMLLSDISWVMLQVIISIYDFSELSTTTCSVENSEQTLNVCFYSMSVSTKSRSLHSDVMTKKEKNWPCICASPWKCNRKTVERHLGFVLPQTARLLCWIGCIWLALIE